MISFTTSFDTNIDIFGTSNEVFKLIAETLEEKRFKHTGNPDYSESQQKWLKVVRGLGWSIYPMIVGYVAYQLLF